MEAIPKKITTAAGCNRGGIVFAALQAEDDMKPLFSINPSSHPELYESHRRVQVIKKGLPAVI